MQSTIKRQTAEFRSRSRLRDRDGTTVTANQLSLPVVGQVSERTAIGGAAVLLVLLVLVMSSSGSGGERITFE